MTPPMPKTAAYQYTGKQFAHLYEGSAHQSGCIVNITLGDADSWNTKVPGKSVPAGLEPPVAPVHTHNISDKSHKGNVRSLQI